MMAQYVKAEQLGIDGSTSGIEEEREDGADSAETTILQPYDPDLIDVVTRTPTVDLLLSRLRHDRIDLAPDFQRKAGIWTDVAQSRLIESLLLRIPLPTLYASEDEDERWLIVDGIQRLTSIARFVEASAVGKAPLRLTRLEYLKQYEGAGFPDLPGRLQTRVRETELVLHLIRLGTPDEVKYNIFARINTGGLPLSAQELRHALVPGPARKLLKELAESEEFLEATTRSVNDDRMGDREMVLRFIAFLSSDPEKYSSQEFDQFLRSAMVRVNTLDPSEVEEMKDSFRTAMVTAQLIFGPNAFRKIYGESYSRYPINKALFETVSVALARMDGQQRATLVERAGSVVEGYKELLLEHDFERAVSQGTGDIQKVRHRFREIARLFRDILDD